MNLNETAPASMDQFML